MQPCYTIKTYIIEKKNTEQDLLDSKIIETKNTDLDLLDSKP